MKKILAVTMAVTIIIAVFSACSNGGNNAPSSVTTTQESTQAQTTTEATTSTTTTTTTEKQVYYPTEEEYMKLFDQEVAYFINYNYTKTYSESSNSITVSWDVQFNRAISMHYVLSLYKNEDNRITWCAVNVMHEKFYNVFNDLLNEDAQYGVWAYVIMPSFLLACLHNSEEYSEDKYREACIPVWKGVLGTTQKYDSTLLDCDYSVTVNNETGVTSMLDYGGNTH